jgi:hypothetical protein
MAIRLELPAILDNEDDRVATTLVIALKTKIVCGAAQKMVGPMWPRNVTPGRPCPRDLGQFQCRQPVKFSRHAR